jgi:flagellin
MGLVINHNLMAMAASRNLGATYGMLAKSIARLSSGLRINSAADDAAGLAVREFMRSEIAVLNQGVRNANDAVSMLQTMDGAAQVIDEKLIRMKELAEQAATGTYSDEQRAIMHDEFAAMRDEIDRIANATDFNGVKMLNGEIDASAITVATQSVALDGQSAVATQSVRFWSRYTSGIADGQVGSATIFTIEINDHDTGVVRYSQISAMATIALLQTRITADADVSGTAVYTPATGNFTFYGMHSGATNLDIRIIKGSSVIEGAATLGRNTTEATYGDVKIHFGTGNSSAEDYYYANKQDMTAFGLGISGLSIANQGDAQATIATLNEAIATKDTSRAHFGAMMNRLANTVSNITIQAENIQAAESQISDVDVALEMTRFVSNQIKAQAAVAMLAQANMLPQLALTLLGGGP